MLRHPRTAVALVAWTLVVWGTRLRNLWADDLGGGELLGRVGLAASFTVLALAALTALWRERGSGLSAASAAAVTTLAAWTAVVWVARMVGIAASGHDVAFVVVHVVLGLVSIGLAALALRGLSVARGARGSGRVTSDLSRSG
jgi:aryl carrier-like protein